jgi:hypothetical protein
MRGRRTMREAAFFSPDGAAQAIPGHDDVFTDETHAPHPLRLHPALEKVPETSIPEV